MPRTLRHQLTISLINERQQRWVWNLVVQRKLLSWWIAATFICWFELLTHENRVWGGRRSYSLLTHSQQPRSDRWAEPFREQKSHFYVGPSPCPQVKKRRWLPVLHRKIGLLKGYATDKAEVSLLVLFQWWSQRFNMKTKKTVIDKRNKENFQELVWTYDYIDLQTRCQCDHHRVIISVSTASRTLAFFPYHDLFCACEVHRRDSVQVLTRSEMYRALFSMWQMLEHWRSFRKSANSVFLDLKTASDSVDRAILWLCLSVIYVGKKFILLLPLVCVINQIRVSA